MPATEERMPALERRAREPWPWIVGGLLASMIGVSFAFLATAIRHPDPPVVDDAYRAGLEYAVGFESPVPLADAEADPSTPDAPVSGPGAPEATP